MRLLPDYPRAGEDALGLAVVVYWFLIGLLYYFHQPVEGIGSAGVVIVLMAFISLGLALYYAYRLLKHRGKKPSGKDSSDGSRHDG